jgi:hypothetical protein
MTPFIVPDGTVLVDTAAKITLARIKALKEFQFNGTPVSGIIRYVSYSNLPAPGDITQEEADMITGEGMLLGLVQHVRGSAWSPCSQLGATDGFVAGLHAQDIGYPEGCHIGMDDENVRVGTNPTYMIDHANTWATAVRPYTALMYVGFNSGLNADQLFSINNVHAYWSDYGAGRAVSRRGFMLKQHAPMVIGDCQYDVDVAWADNIGDRCKFATA